MTRWKYERIPNLKGNKHKLDELGAAGWELVAVDEGEGVLKRAEEAPVEVRAVRFERGREPQEVLDEMVGQGWRLAGSVVVGPRAFDAALLFEREAG